MNRRSSRLFWVLAISSLTLGAVSAKAETENAPSVSKTSQVTLEGHRLTARVGGSLEDRTTVVIETPALGAHTYVLGCPEAKVIDQDAFDVGGKVTIRRNVAGSVQIGPIGKHSTQGAIIIGGQRPGKVNTAKQIEPGTQ